MSDKTAGIAAIYSAEQHNLRLRLIRRGLDAQQASDAVHDIFLRLLRFPPDDLRDPGAYLRRSADMMAIDHWRRQQRHVALFQPLVVDASVASDEAPSAEGQMLTGERDARLRRAIEDLPPRSREVLLLHKYEGLSYAEVALRLGIARNTVMVHLANAMRSLRAALRTAD
ncbi:MAG TPA: RNA polymerase sigma factor [Bosea sp. (in: a-proteobacteria)]|jgi:RNA polymerase sigma-70 factor (ECF subfamily)|uniref:RNA polymerase sigma factor n=1 Tax=Bosea sp. (in: a-proteobacteria) TaxID=1871050 RepID=UPI002E139ABA|nr:RNA polymerase sigma factor [Bosea sp. (in: a-proteobacteria)]